MSAGPRPLSWCRCGSYCPTVYLRVDTGSDQWGLTWKFIPDGALVEFLLAHKGRSGHRVVRDDYRAWCRRDPVGCRNCGVLPEGRKRVYCSDGCRVAFEADHFWGTARMLAVRRATVEGCVLCARCGEPIPRTYPASEEVNHIIPVNGDRRYFSCANHQDNLEVLCHSCHVVATAEQRAAGLIRRGKAVRV